MYFKEAVTESDVENFRVRKCVLYFYLTDGTMHIAEPKVENSGIPHGVFLKRQTLMKPDGETPYELIDFTIGNEISVNSRVFRVVDSDGYTRKFLAETMGVVLGAAERWVGRGSGEKRGE